MAVEQGLDAQRIRELDKAHVLHSWSVQNQLQSLPVAGAEGRYFWDYDGNRYLDFASQLVNVALGHQHPKVVAAIKEQAEKLCTIGPPMAHEKRSTLARMLAEITPGDLKMSFFTNGGAEANENAIKLARWYTGRTKLVARYRSYHGATAGAVTLTGDPRRWYAEPGIPGVVRMFDPYTYRCPADLRRGNGGVRAQWQVVRVRALGRRARHPHDREGDQLGLRAARGDDGARAHRGLGQGQVLRRRPHVQRPRARVRVRGRFDRGLQRKGDRRELRRDGRSARRGARTSTETPSVDRRRPRQRTLLRRRARAQPRDEGDARPVQRDGRGGGADRSDHALGAGARPLPDDALERDHHRAAAHDHP